MGVNHQRYQFGAFTAFMYSSSTGYPPGQGSCRVGICSPIVYDPVLTVNQEQSWPTVQCSPVPACEGAWEVWSNAFTYICSSIWTQVLSRPTKRHGAMLGPMFFIQIPNRVLKSCFPLKHWVFSIQTKHHDDFRWPFMISQDFPFRFLFKPSQGTKSM